MASLTLNYCKLLCTRSYTSSISRVCAATRSHPHTRSLQILSRTNQQADSNEEEPRDFDENRDAVLGDFSKYDLSAETVKRLKNAGVNHLFEVQYKTYKEVREGIDVFVQARTGTGKTLGFALPIIEAVQAEGPVRSKIYPKPPQVLALAPTRELAIQIAKEFEKFSARTTKVDCFYGGVSMRPQDSALYRGVDILVGTPGRILDHLINGKLNLSTTRHVILDEADRMLDMGFQRDIEDILAYAYTKDNKPQTLLFSATLPPWVHSIAKRYTSDNMQQFDLITSAVKSAILVEHKNVLCSPHQYPTIVNHFVEKHCDKEGKALVFTETKREAESLARRLKNADYITGDKSQYQREKTLEGFRRGWFNVLVATDVAARGLDIPKIDFVLQTSPPRDVDDYIHRSGRTGRAGTKGLSIVLHDRTQFGTLRKMEQHAGIKFTVVEDDPKLEEILDTDTGRHDREFGRSVPSNYQRRANNHHSREMSGGFNRRHSNSFESDFTSHKPSRDFNGYNRRASDEGEFGRVSRRNFQGDMDSKVANSIRKGYSLKPSNEFEGRFSPRPLRDIDEQSEDQEQAELSSADETDDTTYQRGFFRRPSNEFQRGLYNRPSRNFDSDFDSRYSSNSSEFNRRPSRNFGGGFNSRYSRDSSEFNRRPSRDFGGKFNSRYSRDSGEFNRRPSRNFEGVFSERGSGLSEDQDPFSSEEYDSGLETSNSSKGKGKARKRIDLLDELD